MSVTSSRTTRAPTRTRPPRPSHDSHDLEDLAVEELAMHYVDEEDASSDGNDDLPEYLRASLAE